MVKVFLGLSTAASFFFATLSLFTLIASLYRKVRFSSAENAGLRSIVSCALGILPLAGVLFLIGAQEGVKEFSGFMAGIIVGLLLALLWLAWKIADLFIKLDRQALTAAVCLHLLLFSAIWLFPILESLLGNPLFWVVAAVLAFGWSFSFLACLFVIAPFVLLLLVI